MSDIIPFEQKLKTEENLQIINEVFPEVQRATGMFNKTQSHYMDNTLTVHHYTPIRNLRQILAEMKRTRLALGEAYYGIQKKEIEIEEKREEMLDASPLKSKRLKIEIEELEWNISEIQQNVSAAIRKLANYSKQYKAIQDYHSLQGFTEEDFEQEEERYHIITAFSQALDAARSNGGRIDQGNQIYFQQIGINGTSAQNEILSYFRREGEMLESGVEPSYEMQYNFLVSMGKKYEGCTKVVNSLKGMIV